MTNEKITTIQIKKKSKPAFDEIDRDYTCFTPFDLLICGQLPDIRLSGQLPIDAAPQVLSCSNRSCLAFLPFAAASLSSLSPQSRIRQQGRARASD